MGESRIRAASIGTLAIAILAAGIFLPAVSSFAQTDRTAPAGTPVLEILAPAEGAAVPPGKVLVIGRVKGVLPAGVEVDVNGKVHHKAALSGGGFMAMVYMTRGKNLLRVHADGASVERTVLASDTVTYRYHPEAEKCAGCHGESVLGYVVSGRKDTVCYRCHDRVDGRKLVHGPLGGGDCTTCHDPHGASNPSLTVARAEGLCVRCHDQDSSTRHMKESRIVGCVTCHDPHSSDREFLQKRK